MSNSGEDDEHLTVDDGCGCAEVWEHLSERRREGHTAGTDEATADD